LDETIIILIPIAFVLNTATNYLIIDCKNKKELSKRDQQLRYNERKIFNNFEELRQLYNYFSL
jgi:hypothetical protein